MMLAAIGREFSRQLSEYKQFKVNLLFANLGIFFLITGFLTYFDSQQDTFELFILLFTWYFLATVSPIQPILSRMRLQTAPLST